MNSAIYHRPMHLRLLNGTGRAISSVGLIERELDAERLMDRARANTGLEDFGPDDFLEPFQLLVHCYNTEARLNFIGWMCARAHILQLLEARLRVEHDRARCSEIAAQQIKAPIFILGLPRTGSTLLFELMSRNPALRSPASWEVMMPSPPPRAETFAIDERIARVERMLGFVHHLAPDFRRIHEIGALMPQECLAITAQAFRSLQFHTTHYLPSYQAWFNTADQTPAYRYHHRLLQHLQAFSPRGTWLLKAPAHLFGIEALFNVYPDARIIQTHRDPVEVVGSICSHCATLRQAFSDHVDLESIGRSWSQLWAMGLKRTRVFRQMHPELADRFVDVDYGQTRANPIGVLQLAHERLGLPWTSEAEEGAQHYLTSHPQARHGRHSYHVNDFGLSDAHVRHGFGDYVGNAADWLGTVHGMSPQYHLSKPLLMR